MNIRSYQFNPTVGDIEGNEKRIRAAYEKANKEGMDMLILPELALLGYPPMDLLERKAFLETVFKTNASLILSTKRCVLLFGTCTPNDSGLGRPIFNSALLAQDGRLLASRHKTLLPTYDVFDDFRYFEPAKNNELVDFGGIRLGISICEDIWNYENEFKYHHYERDLSCEHATQGADLLINISASPFSMNKLALREQMVCGHAKRNNIPILYVNQVGANTEVIFDGDSMAVNSDGTLMQRHPSFEENQHDIVFDNGHFEQAQVLKSIPSKEECLFRALVLGLRDYMKKSGVTDRVTLGLSGGIDSALVAVLAKEALGQDAVLGITMPSEFSSTGSIADSLSLAKNLGIRCEQIAIKPLYDQFLKQLDPLFSGTDFNVAEENIQSRSRGVLLMAVSNKFGHMLLNTGNKSEMAVGYCTLYGDMAGGFSVISDVYKTEVFALCEWLNAHYYKQEVIPRAILEKPPSAELRPDQKDTDSLPEYSILDGILYRYIELQQSVRSIVDAGFDQQTVARITRMVDTNEYKRRQAPPGLRVSLKAFGYGRRLPIVQKWTGHEQNIF